MKYLSLISLLAIGLVSACQTEGVIRNPDLSVVEAAAFSEQARLIAFPSSCSKVLDERIQENNSFGAVAAAFAPILANTAVDYITAKLKEAEAAKTGVFAASGQIENVDSAGCIAVVRGKFGSTQPTEKDSGKIKKAALENFDLHIAPAFLFLMDTNYSAPNLAVTPHYLHFAESSARRNGSGAKSITLNFSLAVSSLQIPDPDAASGREKEKPKPNTPGELTKSKTEGSQKNSGDDEKAKNQTNSSFAFKFDNVRLGTYLHRETISSGSQRYRVQVPDGEPFITVAATVTETEDANLAVKLFVENFTEKQDDVAKALGDWLSNVVNPKSEDEKN